MIILACILLLSGSGMLRAQAVVSVDPQSVCGPVKPMNAGNNGPTERIMESYRALRVPYARTHDTALGEEYGGHCIDINQVFPDWNADVNSPKSYDFTNSDVVLKNIQAAGTKVFYRLGQSIEHQTKKYGIYPPKNYKKWAKICEHIILHYNEGWADGYRLGIDYWEIWNEPDLDDPDDRWKTDPRTWGGTQEQFDELYVVTAKHLKKCFPDLKIGGPSYCRIQGTKTYFPQFFQYMRDNEVPIDFVSWHKYGAEPSVYLMEADLIRGWMKEYGYADAELILNEWNYRRFKEGSGSSNERYNRLNRRSMKGAAFVAATMSALQDAPVDMLMYYDFRANTNYCGFYDYQTQAHQPVYYAFYAWSKLQGSQCACSVEGGAGDIYAVASVQDGKTTLLLTRYDGDNNACNLAKVRVSLSGRSLGKVFCHLTDFEHLYTEIPLFPSEDGQVSIDLWNNSVAILEL